MPVVVVELIIGLCFSGAVAVLLPTPDDDDDDGAENVSIWDAEARGAGLLFLKGVYRFALIC